VWTVIAAAVGASVLFISKESSSLHGFSFFAKPYATSTTHSTGPRTNRPVHRGTARPPAQPGPQPASTHDATSESNSKRGGGFHVGDLEPVLVAGLEVAGGLLLIAAIGAVLVARRMRRRRRREYQLYEVRLSSHDEAKPQDLEDMIESIANIIRVFPGERARSGQPHVALELICGQSPQGVDWSLNIRCEPRSVRALDGAIASAYPDVRVGRHHSDTPSPRAGMLRVPRYVTRFRKERSFVYSLIADGDELASPPLEQIARAQVGLGEPSIVRFQLTPTPSYFEEIARRLYRRHENKLVRAERWGLPEGGLWSTFNRAEMRAAERTQNRSLFWLEMVVAADSMQACKTVAAAVQSRRGENRLHRRCMIVREGLYRRRFPHALGPLIPSMRSLVSAAEAAHLLALPTARMKGVPVRRMTLPRIPAPPDAMRGCRARRTVRDPDWRINTASDEPTAARS